MSATKAVEKTVEIVDVVEDVKDLAEDTVALTEEGVSWLVKNPKAVVIGAAIGGVIIGSALTYVISSRSIKSKAQQHAEVQIASVKAAYAQESKPDLETLADRYATKSDDEAIIESGDISVVTEVDGRGRVAYDKIKQNPNAVAELAQDLSTGPVPGGVVESSVWDNPAPVEKPGFDWDVEKRQRNEFPNLPYLITVEEFNENDTNFQQEFLTFYDEDGVLVDLARTPISAISELLGEGNIHRFGDGSDDDKLVYIRNSKLGIDYEVTKVDTSYAKDVLGLGDDEPSELRHSDRRRLRNRE